MRRSLGWVLAVTAVVVGLALVLGRDPRVPHSAAWSVDAVLGSLIVLAPLAVGVGALDAVRLRRTRGAELLQALPTLQYLRAVAGRILTMTGLAVLGLLVAIAIALVIAAINGSWATAPALGALLPTAAAILAAIATGWLCGRLAGSLLVPPLLAVLAYGALAFDVGGAQWLVGFAGATSETVTFVHISPEAVAVYTAGFLVVASTALAALALAVTRSRWSAGIAAAGVVGLVGLLPLGSGVVAGSLSVPEDPGAWPCTEVVGSESRVCVPEDQRRDLPLLAASLVPLHGRLTEISPGDAAATYSPALWHDNWLQIALPVGQPVDPVRLASEIAVGFAPCLAGDLEPSLLDQVVGQQLVVTAWLEPSANIDPVVAQAVGISPDPPRRAEAAAALAGLRACT